jgi:hypothetical protein
MIDLKAIKQLQNAKSELVYFVQALDDDTMDISNAASPLPAQSY